MEKGLQLELYVPHCQVFVNLGQFGLDCFPDSYVMRFKTLLHVWHHTVHQLICLKVTVIVHCYSKLFEEI
jgi:hypothetical protein